MTSFTEVAGVWRPQRPYRILQGDGKTGPEHRVSGSLGHHRTLPIEARLNGPVEAGVTIQASVGALEIDTLIGLCAGHSDQWVVDHIQNGPSIEATRTKDHKQKRCEHFDFHFRVPPKLVATPVFSQPHAFKNRVNLKGSGFPSFEPPMVRPFGAKDGQKSTAASPATHQTT
jgi:hypothetical protein